MALKLGIVNEVPVLRIEPPVAASYQLIVPALAVASKVTVPVPQRFAGVVAVMVGTAFTVLLAVATVFEFAGFPDTVTLPE